MLKAVSNTSPLLYLYRIGGIDWLPQLFDEVWTSTTTRFSHQRQLEMPILEGIPRYAIVDNLLPPEPSRCAEEAAETSTVKGGSLGFPP